MAAFNCLSLLGRFSARSEDARFSDEQNWYFFCLVRVYEPKCNGISPTIQQKLIFALDFPANLELYTYSVGLRLLKGHFAVHWAA